MTGTDIIRKASIEELAGHRERALELYRQAAEILQEAMKTAAKACPSYTHHTPPAREFERLAYLGRYNSVDGFVTEARKSLDKGIWRHCMQATHLAQVMDATARKQFDEQIEKEPPEATIDNLMATLLSLVGNSGAIFSRGVVETFRTLDPNRYQRNDAFKIKERVAFDRAFTAQVGPYVGSRFWNHYAQINEHLRDIERVFCVMDGKPIPERCGGIVAVIDSTKASGKEAENEYFHCRMYKNGALHLRFKRMDLVRRCNKIIAEHYGETLADASA
jgi:hypothetical protein